MLEAAVSECEIVAVNLQIRLYRCALLLRPLSGRAGGGGLNHPYCLKA